MTRITLAIVISLAAVALSACGGGMSAPKMPVDEAKGLNAMVTGDYQTTTSTWQAAQENAGQIGLLTDVDVATLKLDDFKANLTDCFNAPIETLEAVKTEANEAAADAGEGKDQAASKDLAQGIKASKVGYAEIKNCPANSEENLAGYTANANEQTANFYVAKLAQVDNLRKDLVHILPTNVENLVTGAPDIIEQAAKIRANAEAALKATTANPLAKDADKKKAQEDYDTVITELDAVEATATAIQSDLVNLPAEITNLATKVSTDIQNLGQNPSDS